MDIGPQWAGQCRVGQAGRAGGPRQAARPTAQTSAMAVWAGAGPDPVVPPSSRHFVSLAAPADPPHHGLPLGVQADGEVVALPGDLPAQQLEETGQKLQSHHHHLTPPHHGDCRLAPVPSTGRAPSPHFTLLVVGPS